MNLRPFICQVYFGGTEMQTWAVFLWGRVLSSRYGRGQGRMYFYQDSNPGVDFRNGGLVPEVRLG